MKTETKNELEKAFENACQNGNFQAIKVLLEKKPVKKNIFSSFLSIFHKPEPLLSFFNTLDNGFLKLCENGNTEIVSYIIDHPSFKSEVNANHIETHNNNNYFKSIASGFFISAKNGHYECANLLTHYVNEKENVLTLFHNEFVEACASGNFPYVKFLATHEEISYNLSIIINYRLDELHSVNEFFIYACENGHLDVVKYLTSDKDLTETIKLDYVDDFIKIDNYEVIMHFIFDLNLPKNHKFLNRIICTPEDLVKNLCEKRDLFIKVNDELNKEDYPTKTKKIKI